MSFTVRPHAQDANRFLLHKDLVTEAVLDIDPARKCTDEITDQFFKRWRVLKGVAGSQKNWGFLVSNDQAPLDTDPIRCHR